MMNASSKRVSFLFGKQHCEIEKYTEPAANPRSRSMMIADEIIGLFETYVTIDSNSEPVSLPSHMVQCAMLAMEAISDLPVILGALLHDIGHLLQNEHPMEFRETYNVVSQQGIGAAYLHSKGFSSRVCAIVEQHVAAKRYLVAKDRNYQRRLSVACLKTLEWQGGPMHSEEIAAFEKQPYFQDIVNVCRWDEDARDRKAVLLPVSWFRRIIWDHLAYNV